ncbi:MAG: redox-sensing transcriptional repressor Rex, partial [Clostridia bacterium]
DKDAAIIGTIINGITVKSIDELDSFMKNNRVDIGILTIPKSAVQETAERLADNGIKGILNFSYTELEISKDIAIENVHLSDPMMTLSYKIKQEK